MPTPNANGPDTSHYQTYVIGAPLPWPLHSLKASEGSFYRDPTFGLRWNRLRDLEVKYRLAYHWITPHHPIRDQVTNLVGQLARFGGLRVGEAVQADWEVTPNRGVPTSDMAHEFCDRINQHYGALRSIMYSSDWLPDSTLDADSRAEFAEWREAHPDYPYWHANYNTGDRATGGWAECARYAADVWQWTSSYMHSSIYSPRADGTRGGFDMNHVFRWDTLDLVTARVATLPDPIPTPVPKPEDHMRYIIEDQRLGGAAYWSDTLAPVGPVVVAHARTQSDKITVLQQDHEPTTAAFLDRNGSAVAVALEKFRDSRDGVAD
jgi:hypothetical protein